MGFVINSPRLAGAVADALAEDLSGRLYKVSLNDAGALQWEEQRDGKRLTHAEEPDAGFWRRTLVLVMSMLPIEWLL
jgi:putative cardiolipin synthase